MVQVDIHLSFLAVLRSIPPERRDEMTNYAKSFKTRQLKNRAAKQANSARNSKSAKAAVQKTTPAETAMHTSEVAADQVIVLHLHSRL